MGMAFMRPISIPGYTIVSTDTVTPRHTTAYNARGAIPAYRILIVRIKKMIKRERLTAPKVSGDLVLKNVLGTRRMEFASITSSKTDANSRTRDENTPFKNILSPKRR
jgi:CxxC motif-containing protein